ncbi:MAG TPA: VWA domain-containing protein [Pyrinomonadaceae bacterium]|nr:VWA domain-containing protein [Pyrinomonadaceae bacterium]
MKSSSFTRLACLFFVAAVAAASAFSQGTKPVPTPSPKLPSLNAEEPGIYKVDVELVNIDVRVVDRNGRPVNGLKQSDFKVFEEGEPQQIQFFSTSEVPTNYTMVVDNSGSMRQQLDKVIEAGKILVNANHKDDETSIIRFVGNDKITIDQDFTANKGDLDEALDNMFIEGGQTAVRDAVYLAAQRVSEYEKSNKAEDRKRRAIILVSDGEDRNSYYSEAQLFEMLRESNVQIYVIGFINDLDTEAGFIRKSPKEKSKAFLQRLADETGGRAYFPNSISELPDIAKSIGSELRMQYSIGYLPPNDVQPGAVRSIKVMVNDGPGATKRIAITKASRVSEAAPNSAKKN